MNVPAILEELRAERGRLDAAIAVLEGISSSSPRHFGRKPRRHMSAKARAKIAAAQRARWAKQKKSS